MMMLHACCCCLVSLNMFEKNLFKKFENEVRLHAQKIHSIEMETMFVFLLKFENSLSHKVWLH